MARVGDIITEHGERGRLHTCSKSLFYRLQELYKMNTFPTIKKKITPRSYRKLYYLNIGHI